MFEQPEPFRQEPDVKTAAKGATVTAQKSKTMQRQDQPDRTAQQQAAMAVPQVSATKKVALPESLDTSDQLKRLGYLCRLLRRARQPVCGINGAVALLPFELSQVGPLQLAAFAQSARNDVTTIQKTLGLRSPVTAMLVGTRA